MGGVLDGCLCKVLDWCLCRVLDGCLGGGGMLGLGGALGQESGWVIGGAQQPL